jgi:8-amino-7-oxononanoate synthase
MAQEGNDGWAEQLADLAARGLRRELRVVAPAPAGRVRIAGRTLCDFSSNNYLNLATHPRVVAAVQSAVQEWGWGTGASALISGHTALHQQLEARLAAFKGAEAALVFSTGFQANLAAIAGLAGEGDVVLLDKLDHASIIDGARASGAVLRVFPHRNCEKLERLLEGASDARRRVIVTDSLFSMDGDFADLPRLVELKRRYDAQLVIDEAHATGVVGQHGRGLAEAMGVESEIDVTVGTLSKALGGIGGFVAGRRELIDWLVNTARAFIYTTALPAAACAAALAALEVIDSPDGRERRERLLNMAELLRRELAGRGFDVGGSSSQIVPVVVGEAEAAVQISRTLEEQGMLVPAIRPPTVPRGRARLRISLCSEHTPADVEALIAAIENSSGGGSHSLPHG